MPPLTGKARAALRKEANALPAVFQVGKGGIDAPLTQGVAQCLQKRELVKLRFLESCPQDARAAAEALCAATGAEVVQLIGRVAVLYKKNPDKKSEKGGAKRQKSNGK